MWNSTTVKMYEYLENFTNNLLNKAKSTKLPSLDDNLMFQGFLKKIHTIKQIERDLITKLEIDKTIGIEPYQLDKLPNVIVSYKSSSTIALFLN